MRRVLKGIPLTIPLCAVLLMGAGPLDETPRQVSLTIYNGNLALVQEVRRLDVPAGRTRLEFRNVSTGIRPETVALAGTGLSIVEQNYDYDLLTPSKMMEKAVGKEIRIVRTNPATGAETMTTATVLSVNDGVVLKMGDRIEVLRDDGIPTRVIFDGIPENLRARPTLSVTVEAAGAGARDATLSYLSTGLSWTADYVAQYDEAGGQLALQGWVTLTNRTDTRFADVTPRLVAESVGTAPRPFGATPAGGVRTAGQGTAAGNNSEDFPVYVLPGKVTVAEQQTKQVSFLEAPNIRAQKIYEYRSGGFASYDAPAHVSTNLALTNPKQMPAGVVRVYMRDADGAPKFVGEQRLSAAPAGSGLFLQLGEAFDVTVKPTLTDSEVLA
ncbi:MAG TPA: DUF4139 domain-containing protein, partial [Rhizomicrobium sp.]|nr:DUF4139 domain-containing protein [Rhizomicrobium sp.]